MSQSTPCQTTGEERAILAAEAEDGSQPPPASAAETSYGDDIDDEDMIEKAKDVEAGFPKPAAATPKSATAPKPATPAAASKSATPAPASKPSSAVPCSSYGESDIDEDFKAEMLKAASAAEDKHSSSSSTLKPSTPKPASAAGTSSFDGGDIDTEVESAMAEAARLTESEIGKAEEKADSDSSDEPWNVGDSIEDDMVEKMDDEEMTDAFDEEVDDLPLASEMDIDDPAPADPASSSPGFPAAATYTTPGSSGPAPAASGFPPVYAGPEPAGPAVSGPASSSPGFPEAASYTPGSSGPAPAAPGFPPVYAGPGSSGPAFSGHGVPLGAPSTPENSAPAPPGHAPPGHAPPGPAFGSSTMVPPPATPTPGPVFPAPPIGAPLPAGLIPGYYPPPAYVPPPTYVDPFPGPATAPRPGLVFPPPAPAAPVTGLVGPLTTGFGVVPVTAPAPIPGTGFGAFPRPGAGFGGTTPAPTSAATPGSGSSMFGPSGFLDDRIKTTSPAAPRPAAAPAGIMYGSFGPVPVHPATSAPPTTGFGGTSVPRPGFGGFSARPPFGAPAAPTAPAAVPPPFVVPAAPMVPAAVPAGGAPAADDVDAGRVHTGLADPWNPDPYWDGDLIAEREMAQMSYVDYYDGGKISFEQRYMNEPVDSWELNALYQAFAYACFGDVSRWTDVRRRVQRLYTAVFDSDSGHNPARVSRNPLYAALGETRLYGEVSAAQQGSLFLCQLLADAYDVHIYVLIPVGTRFSDDGNEIITQRWDLRWRGDTTADTNRKIYLAFYPGIVHWTALRRIETDERTGAPIRYRDPLDQVADKKRAQWPRNYGGVPRPLPRIPDANHGGRGDGHEPDTFPYTGPHYHLSQLGDKGEVVWGLFVWEGTTPATAASGAVGRGKGKAVTFDDSTTVVDTPAAGYTAPKGPRQSPRIRLASLSKSASPAPELPPIVPRRKTSVTAKKTGTSANPARKRANRTPSPSAGGKRRLSKSPSPTTKLLQRRPSKKVKPAGEPKTPVKKPGWSDTHAPLPKAPLLVKTTGLGRAARAAKRALASGKDPVVLDVEALDAFNDKSKL